MQQHVPQTVPVPRRLMVPRAPVIAAAGQDFFCLTAEGELTKLSPDAAKNLLRAEMPIVCHAPYIAQCLKMERFPAYDVLELFAFVQPGKFAVPTPTGLARAMHLVEPATLEDQCLSLKDCVRHLLVELSQPGRVERTNPAAIAAMMGMFDVANAEKESGRTMGWPWAETVLAALGRRDNPPSRGEIKAALNIWDRLPEWSVHAPEPPAGHLGVSAEETLGRLHMLLSSQKKEERPQQADYAAKLSSAFAPSDAADEANVVMAEAGTGVGKTLGYLSPATLWSEKNGGTVWISTFTRNLQRQIDAELDRLYDDPVTKARKVVTRKGRENYLCLLNLEEASQSPTLATNELNAVAAGLMLRWAAVTDSGDLSGRDFPGWLTGLLGWNRVHGLADRRGECIYSACPHFNRCFIEKNVRKAKRADIVIANHALVMHQTAMADEKLPSRYIFDEGHHLFEAADSAFCNHLNGFETADLRRWLLGTETSQKGRMRGIRRRLEDLTAGDDEAARDMEALLEAARALPGPSWRQRIESGKSKGIVEAFLSLCREQVFARNKEQTGGYSLETPAQPLIPGMFEAAHALSLRLNDLKRPMLSLAQHLTKKLNDEADTLDTDMRERIRFMTSSLEWRANTVVGGWIAMLESLKGKDAEGCVDWLEVSRIDGREDDAGFYRYALDPAALFAAQMKPHAQGIVVTSATLRDPAPEDSEGWKSAETRTGIRHLSSKPQLFSVSSPFDYARQTRILIVKDVKKDDTAETAAACRALFTASGGGALGIFTSIQRLKAVHEKLLGPLEKNGLRLYAQHMDSLDISTLIDIFREEENACLLGTDATRDGIDVPGRSLRLVVYDRVPWPRPTILHKARRDYFGKGYDDMLTRFKLKQAYGRLIRRADDKGVFVMLDGALPSRLLTAFPEGCTIERVGLAEAVKAAESFLKE